MRPTKAWKQTWDFWIENIGVLSPELSRKGGVGSRLVSPRTLHTPHFMGK